MAAIKKYKISLVGSMRTGKSALAVQFLKGSKVDEYDLTRDDSYLKRLSVDGEECILEIFDADCDEFPGVRDQYLRGADGFLLVFSSFVSDSFEQVQYFRERICQIKDIDDPPMVLVENRFGQADRDMYLAEEFAAENRIPFITVSTKIGHNIEQPYIELVRALRLHTHAKTGGKEKERHVDFEAGCVGFVRAVVRGGHRLANKVMGCAGKHA